MKRTEQDPSPEELEQLAGAVDIILGEGFKKSAKHKIEVFRHGVSGDRPLCLDDPSFLALVRDSAVTVSLPQYDINDAEGVAEFIVHTITP
jgi:molybdopterin-guanine dinucleotide biosynthesis protein B